MADLTITAANVAPGSGASIDRSRNAGVAVTAGQIVYLESATSTYKLADNNSATVEARVPAGIALNNAAAGQPLAVLTAGPVTLGAAISANVEYYLSGTPGAVCPVADLVTGMYPSSLGFANSTTVLNVSIRSASGAL